MLRNRNRRYGRGSDDMLRAGGGDCCGARRQARGVLQLKVRGSALTDSPGSTAGPSGLASAEARAARGPEPRAPVPAPPTP